MKKIINGKMYNTETAQLVGEHYANGYGNFQSWQELLYKKKTGEYFLYGSGGAMSKYAQSVSYNETSGSSQILPMTEGEAKKWAEKYLDGDEYESIFGEVEE